MNQKALKLLLAGEYICPIRYRPEFDAINTPSDSEEVNGWLMKMGMRLARIGDEGAFFMTPEFIGPREVLQVKAEFIKFRDEYGPAVVLLDFIRQVKSDSLHLSPGEYIQVYDLDAAVAQSSTIETQLKSLIGLIHNGAQRNSNHENLNRLMAHLCKDGYLMLANKDTGAYQVTGKIEQLYAVLQFLDENEVIPDSEIDDRTDPQEDLVENLQSSEGELNAPDGQEMQDGQESGEPA